MVHFENRQKTEIAFTNRHFSLVSHWIHDDQTTNPSECSRNRESQTKPFWLSLVTNFFSVIIAADQSDRACLLLFLCSRIQRGRRECEKKRKRNQETIYSYLWPGWYGTAWCPGFCTHTQIHKQCSSRRQRRREGSEPKGFEAEFPLPKKWIQTPVESRRKGESICLLGWLLKWSVFPVPPPSRLLGFDPEKGSRIFKCFRRES